VASLRDLASTDTLICVPRSPKNRNVTDARKGDLAGQGTSRVKQDKSQADIDQTLERRSLIEELEDIGRNQRSMEPAALGGYPYLLGCSAVLSRVRQGLTKEQAAHDALKDAIAALPTPDDRLIGQAILAADKFVGDEVNTRKRTLDEDHGIDENRYKRRRPKILSLLAGYLEPETGRTDDMADYTASIRDLTCLFTDVAHLSYCCVAYTFVLDFDKQLNEASASDSQRLRRHRHSITDGIYKAYLELVWSAGYCLDEAPYSGRTRIATALPDDVLPHIATLLDHIFELMPFSTRQRAAFCLNRYNSPSLFDYRNSLGIYRSYLWTPWEREHLDFIPNLYSSAIPIYIRCRELLLNVFHTLNIRLDRAPEFMEAFVAAVANYYGVELSTYIFNGKSLDDYCKGYIGDSDVFAYDTLHRV
jgi:hypothetical protein